ncbi:MAG: monovalent cation/H+ antiporter complex subunit F [Chloroflexota bacterium]|nr:monovalent cation/H+ antiporter complex subunit F [Chloroflexota bacterium]
MSELVDGIVQIALVIMVGLLLPCAYRVFIGPSAADRLQAIETITTLLIGVIVLLAIIQGSAFVVDVALALAAFSFVATLAIARYLSEGRMF